MDFEDLFTCPFNFGVDCINRRACPSCGWNPVVANARKQLIREKGYNALVKDYRPKNRRNKSLDAELVSDRYAWHYIKEHAVDFGGNMTRWQIQKALHIGNERYKRLENQIKKGR